MPSTVVHVALAGLIGAALLAEHFDGKAVLVVMAAVALVDFDVFVGFWIEGAHRAAFHTVLLPLALGVLLAYDLRVRERSLVRSRWDARGVRIAWVTLVAVTFAGIGLDAFFNGVNLFYPVHDRFYKITGKMFYSTKEGFVQTLVDVNLDALREAVAPESGAEPSGPGGSGGAGGDAEKVRTTKNTHYRTGIDPSKGAEERNVERIFPIAYTGERALLALTGYTVVGLRVWLERRNR
ncbi:MULTISPECIES: metal-dependent hydrolase [Halorussus]|uniref:metal-dependent hydrolase n=1 Tax=Halorussus TaxID=1070314 RepID=UPI0020A03A97|nr:metal-dependent hydrolase [Halorussus vallis]USZ76940.1 metal-dependent hydrolase [Halorussus vallis]